MSFCGGQSDDCGMNALMGVEDLEVGGGFDKGLTTLAF
ncbi:hypothetical protein VDG1235_4739 [Verrucomicrobiia bacterium DG1235]|nr:hypothetical protein VDG1235_4739 [Verrucomicrobiae bacterium DG1235]